MATRCKTNWRQQKNVSRPVTASLTGLLLHVSSGLTTDRQSAMTCLSQNRRLTLTRATAGQAAKNRRTTNIIVISRSSLSSRQNVPTTLDAPARPTQDTTMHLVSSSSSKLHSNHHEHLLMRTSPSSEWPTARVAECSVTSGRPIPKYELVFLRFPRFP